MTRLRLFQVKKPVNLKPDFPTKSEGQMSFISPNLMDQLNPTHEPVILAEKIPWNFLEDELAGFYSDKMGRPAKPIRLMTGLMILKQMESLSDEKIVETWARDPYMQHFCGETQFQWQLPCDSSDLTHFRKRIGEAGRLPKQMGLS